MTIDWLHFSPALSLLGGVLIGLAAVLAALCFSRIAGISGILEGLLIPKKNDAAWRLAFLGGLITSPFAYALVSPVPVPTVSASLPLLLVAGVLVGFGTRLGGGCTSGHGVCGLSRFARRSVVATATFMAAGFLTVFVIRHVG